MQTCPKCQAHLIDGAPFCHKCGAAVSTEAAAKLEKARKLSELDELETNPNTDDVFNAKPDAAAVDHILDPGTVFSKRYTIEDIIGRGGMGVVYKAKDTLVEDTIALKLIRPERLKGATAISRLISEGTVARNIRHPNVVAVYDVGTLDGQAFISMEYIDGDSLRVWHRKKGGPKANIPFRVAARIMVEILDGLTAAHEAGIVHRDLKPENIVLTAEPTEKKAPLKIIDFGLALTKGPLSGTSSSGKGSIGYMAPEQITHPDSAGPEADCFALSVIFYELLIGTVPTGSWQPPSSRRSDIPKAIDTLINNGLSDYTNSRPEDAADYRAQLIAAVNHPAGQSKSGPAQKKTGLFTPPDPDSLSGQLRAEWIEQWKAQPAIVRWTTITLTAIIILGIAFSDV